MNITTSQIDEILIKEDIEGLIEIGAPIDEYSDEAAQIFEIISKFEEEDFTEDIIKSAIILVWMQSFNLDEDAMNLRMDHVKNVAKMIYDFEQNYKSI